jgi:ribosomal protein L15
MLDRRDLHADRRRGLCQFPSNALLQVQQRVKLLVREVGPQEYTLVFAADAVDSAVALHEPHRVPRHVEVDDVPALLKVHAFSAQAKAKVEAAGGTCEVVQI